MGLKLKERRRLLSTFAFGTGIFQIGTVKQLIFLGLIWELHFNTWATILVHLEGKVLVQEWRNVMGQIC